LSQAAAELKKSQLRRGAQDAKDALIQWQWFLETYKSAASKLSPFPGEIRL
jgi:hypothetical protein